jgi:microsomal dipeptidase-like Zn-dependent dipeptidase
MTMNRAVLPMLLAGVAGVLSACSGSVPPGDTGETGGDTPSTRTVYSVANGCYALQSPRSSRFLAKAGDGSYHFTAEAAGDATPFFMRASGLGTYLLFDADEDFLSIRDGLALVADGTGLLVDTAGDLVYGVGDTLGLVDTLDPIGDIVNDVGELISNLGTTLAQFSGPNAVIQSMSFAWDNAEWALSQPQSDLFSLRSTSMDLNLVAEPTGDGLSLAPRHGSGEGLDRFRLVATQGCATFPEIGVSAHGETFKGTNADGTVFGIADTHIHISAYEFLGGRVNYGEPFHRFGVKQALGNCIVEHGPYGLTGLVEIALGSPVGHRTEGWPTFKDWPNQASYLHHQTYYTWMKRAWMAGVRLMVNELVQNELLCEIWPIRDRECKEMDSVRLQRQSMYQLQDYIDAQEGGPGQGWLRIVTTPAEARAVIEDGKLAVVLGVEVSKMFNCGLFLGQAECTREDIDAGIDEIWQLGIRSFFPTHDFDNAFAGSGLFAASEVFLNVGNKVETGEYFHAETCPEEGHGANLVGIPEIPIDNVFAALINQTLGLVLPTYPPAPHCNSRELTDLGEYVIQKMMDQGFILETDHLAHRARYKVIEMARANGNYPMISSHSRAGGEYTENMRQLMHSSGAMISPLPRDWSAVEMTQALLHEIEFKNQNRVSYFGVGFGSDINGMALQPGVRADAAEHPLQYPFKSYDGKVTFERQVSGERVFDLNLDGVAHYGLYADLFADIQQQPGGDEAMKYLFRSAEAYLQLWQRAYERRQ